MPHDLHVVLVEPEIPQNTGSVGRLCLATGATLHLVEPLAFEITHARLRRAGLDYWEHLKVITHKSVEAFLESCPRRAESVLHQESGRDAVSTSLRARDLFDLRQGDRRASRLADESQCCRLRAHSDVRRACALAQSRQRREYRGLRGHSAARGLITQTFSSRRRQLVFRPELPAPGYRSTRPPSRREYPRRTRPRPGARSFRSRSPRGDRGGG